MLLIAQQQKDAGALEAWARQWLCDSAVVVLFQGVDTVQRWIVFRKNPCSAPLFALPSSAAGECALDAYDPIKTDAWGGFEQLLMASVGSISGIFLPALQCRSTVGGKMLNIKFCSNCTTEKLRSRRRC